jgi:hypothetical protein
MLKQVAMIVWKNLENDVLAHVIVCGLGMADVVPLAVSGHRPGGEEDRLTK